EVFEEIVEEENEESIILPNIFTPNNDGSNDFFTIEMSEKLDFQIVVIDQTNTVVFQSNDRNFRWDGTMMSGEPAPSGNYVYFLSAKTMGGNDFVKSSKLRIQR
ncbi:gliding motility-associated C-terminal domain-containing protein, partial [Crocinitomicaceae bacterium]|nr:gliding motility-associated C-terminal domain-containing protein [Crocinitomicaceae bacterium]